MRNFLQWGGVRIAQTQASDVHLAIQRGIIVKNIINATANARIITVTPC
jgi:hypothetical protein